MANEQSSTLKRGYRICLRCIMDTSDPEIRFDDQGFCNHCTAALARFRDELIPAEDQPRALNSLVDKIRADGVAKEYDCVIGVSGGVDSTSVAVLVQELGLRPLAVHFDNGWNSELAVDNITRILTDLEIDLETLVVDWDEFRDLQLAFLKAGVANAEAPTDHAIAALLFRAARTRKLRYILSGSNLATEAIMPLAWGHFNQDLRQLKAIHRRFGTVPLHSMPTIGLPQYLNDVFIRGIRQIPLLNYTDYRRDDWKQRLTDEFGWRDYGGKHYESVWTRFFQGFYLPARFGFDKRRSHLSTLICSGQLTREDALRAIESPPYPDERLLREDRVFVLKKLRLSETEFAELIASPPRRATDYPSHNLLFRRLGRYKDRFRRVATTPG